MNLTKSGIVALLIIILSASVYAEFLTIYNPFTGKLDYVRGYNWSDSNVTFNCIAVGLNKYCTPLQLNLSAETCAGTNKFSAYANGVFTCSADSTGSGSFTPDNASLINVAGLDQVNSSWLVTQVGNYSSAVLNNVSATTIGTWIVGNVSSANATMKAYVDANAATSANVLSWVGNYSSAVLNNVSATTIGTWILGNVTSANLTMKAYVDARVGSMYNTTYTNTSIIGYTDNRFSSMSNVSSTSIGDWIVGNVTSANSTLRAYNLILINNLNTSLIGYANNVNASARAYTESQATTTNASWKAAGFLINGTDANFNEAKAKVFNSTLGNTTIGTGTSGGNFHIDFNGTHYTLWGG